MFVMIYCKSRSIITCIISHGLFNSLSAFSNEALLTTKNQIISSILLTLITSAYAIYLAFAIKKEN
jgi:membrane protease YdiL (CAAX protease family)